MAARNGRGGARPGAGRKPKSVRERQRNAIKVSFTDAELAHVAGALIAGEKGELRREPISNDTPSHIADMARILGAKCASMSDTIDLVRDGIVMRLEADLAEFMEPRNGAEARA